MAVGICVKFRERFFLFDRARPFFFFDKTKKKNGGANRPPVLVGGAKYHAATEADRPGGRSLRTETDVAPTGERRLPLHIQNDTPRCMARRGVFVCMVQNGSSGFLRLSVGL